MMKRGLAVLLAVCLAGPGLGCTLDQVSKVQLADGSFISFTGREGDKITQKVRDLTQVHWQGVIPLSSGNRQSVQEWVWNTALPDLTTLAEGAQIRLSAAKTFNGRPDVQVGLVIRNEGSAVDRIGDCDWPVMLLRMQETVDGRPRGEWVNHFHAPSLTVLNVTVKNLFTGEEALDPVMAVE